MTCRYAIQIVNLIYSPLFFVWGLFSVLSQVLRSKLRSDALPVTSANFYGIATHELQLFSCVYSNLAI